MLADTRNAVDAAHDIVGELGHEENIAVRHDGDWPIAQSRVMIANDGGGLRVCVSANSHMVLMKS